MKKILLLATGGTIASKPTGSGLAPRLSAEEITDSVPEINELCEFDCEMLFSLDSTNITPQNWISIAEKIRERYDDYDGFVITHGTDTLSYTAAALSYMIRKSPKPIVLTGSQKSIHMRDTDARNNLFDAFAYASDERAAGVRIVFNSRVIMGTRGRKIRTQSYNAFESTDYPVVARVEGSRVIHYIPAEYSKPAPIFDIKMEPSVVPLKLIPGLDGRVIDKLAEIYKAIIIEAFGQGGLPENGEYSLRKAADRFTEKGGLVAMTTQVPYEGSNLRTYKVGRELCDNPNVLEGGNMTMEAMTCKLMWILAKTNDKKEIHRLFYEEVDCDIL